MIKAGIGSLCFLATLAIISVLNQGKCTSLAFSSESTGIAAVHRSNSYRSHCKQWTVLSAQPPPAAEFHTVQGILCREVTNELPVIGKIVVLEATADAQEELVDECLELEDERNDSDQQKRIAEGDPYGYVCHIKQENQIH